MEALPYDDLTGSHVSHYAIVEPLNGKNAEWMEHVSDVQYGGGESRLCKHPAVATEKADAGR